MIVHNAAIMFYTVLTGVLSLTLATHHVYHVQPDNKLCVQLSCPTLQHIIDHHHMYFMSNTTLLFGEGEYNHVQGDLIVQNVTNFSLICNTSDTTSPVGIIRCLPEHLIYFYNVTNLLIKNLKFQGCGSLMPKFSGPLYVSGAVRLYWASVYIHYCSNVEAISLVIENPVGYAISGLNVMGNSSLTDVTIMMGREELYSFILFTCSYAVHWMYGESVGGSVEVVFLYITNIALKETFDEYSISSASGQDLIDIIIHQYPVHITITNSYFHKLTSNIIKCNISSLSHNSIKVCNCTFIWNRVAYIIDIHCNVAHIVQSKYELSRLDATLADIDFIGNTHLIRNSHFNSYRFDSSILRCLLHVSSHNSSLNLTNIIFHNIWFHANRLPLLKMLSSTPVLAPQSPLIITITGYFVADSNGRFYYHYRLISITNGKMHFNGIAKFTGNVAVEIIQSSSSLLSFSNITVFIGNVCDQLIFLDCQLQMCYLALLEHANLILSSNEVHNEMINIITQHNSPYPYCIFQYYSLPSNKHEDFKIQILLLNNESSIVNEILKQTVHCRWAPGTASRNINPLILNSNVINFKGASRIKLGDHTTVCYCPASSRYNCSVDQLGPVYPGENLTVDLCLPYNDENTGILYIETYNDDLPKSACKLADYNSMKHVFHKDKCSTVYFTIAFRQPGAVGCELFLTAQPNLYTSYDVFYVHLLPCPLGFTLQHGICDCDPDLRKYIDECMISSQTVRQFAGVYILGTVSVNSTDTYIISTDCPIDYCIQGKTRISLHHPDAQCQPHRTGLLCSQCTDGYSVVLGSNQCKMCNNKHLLFILYILFTSLFLVTLLFVLNLTVTRGTINGHIFYVNIVWINSSYFHLHDRLITFLYYYISITNLGASFEMCLYEQMDMYAKKWIQFAFPLYLILIAVSFIIGT